MSTIPQPITLQGPEPCTETLAWISADAELPDSDTTVMVTLVGDDEPTWPGYWDGDQWRSATTGSAFSGKVVAWAAMPAGAVECAA